MIDARSAELAIFTSYLTRREWNNCFIKNKPLDIYESKSFLKLLLQQKLSFIRTYARVIWRAFWSSNDTRRNFRAFQTSLKFVFLVYSASSLRRFRFSFSVWVFEMILRPLLYLLNTGFTIIENGLFESLSCIRVDRTGEYDPKRSVWTLIAFYTEKKYPFSKMSGLVWRENWRLK